MDASPRDLILLRAAIGAALTAFPDRVASVAEGRPAGRPARVFTRALGMRHLTQAVLTALAPGLLTPSRGAAIDGLHTATTVLLATVSPRHRRAALMNSAVAATLCALGMLRADGRRRERRTATVEPANDPDMPPPSALQGIPPMPAQLIRPRSETPRPQDSDQFSLGLGDDSKLERAKLTAGVLSVLALIAMLITSLFRAPNPASTVVLAVLAGGLIAAMSARMVRRRADRRRRSCDQAALDINQR